MADTPERFAVHESGAYFHGTKAQLSVGDLLIAEVAPSCTTRARRYEDWTLPDPAGQSPDVVRSIGDEIESRVRALLASLGVVP